MQEIDKEITLEKEINKESDQEFENITNKINEIEKNIESENAINSPIKEKNFEILSKIQRLNLELKSLDEENERIQKEIENFKNSLVEIDNDLDREKGITIDANSNEKRLKEEKNDLINIDTKYYDTEKKSNDDLFSIKDKLKNYLEDIKNLVSQNQNDNAIKAIDECKNIIEEYAESYSKNQNIKNDSIKRKERIKIINTEIESWKNLLENSDKSIKQLNERRTKSSDQLNLLENKPNTQAEKKGQLTENLRLSEIEKKENELSLIHI